MKNDVLIVGKGYIGEKLQKAWGCAITDRWIASYADLLDEVKKHKAKVVINCIGYTGARNVDDCEKDIDATITANTIVPIWFGELAFREPVKVVHISSGCIYDYDYASQPPIEENLTPAYYKLFYSRTKIYAEAVLEPLSRRCNILITRIRVPLDDKPSPRNLIDKLIRYKKVIDVPNSVTYLPDFVKAMGHLIDIDARGIYNVVAKGPLVYPKMMDLYKTYCPSFAYEVLPIKDLGLNRTNLVLSVSKLEKTGFKVRTIEEILDECIRNYTKS
jgi:3,5-epimerase/4-reductase